MLVKAILYTALSGMLKVRKHVKTAARQRRCTSVLMRGKSHNRSLSCQHMWVLEALGASGDYANMTAAQAAVTGSSSC
jgi:hypothetical protein